jgi:hypothetical protein
MMNFRMHIIPITKTPTNIKLSTGAIRRLLQGAEGPHPPGALASAATGRDEIEPELNGAIDNRSRLDLRVE